MWPDALSFPTPGVTGWQDRTEGPLWVFRKKLVPYCVYLEPGTQRGIAASQAVLPCRYTPGFPCCRYGYTNPYRWWHTR